MFVVRRRIVIMKALGLFLAAILTIGWAIPAFAIADDIVVIANENYPANRLTLQSVKSIYLGEKEYERSVKIKPINQKDANLIKKEFIEKALSATVDVYRSYWLKKVFKEGAIPPPSKESSQEVIKTVIYEDGAVGYVWSEEAQRETGIKVLLIIKIE